HRSLLPLDEWPVDRASTRLERNPKCRSRHQTFVRSPGAARPYARFRQGGLMKFLFADSVDTIDPEYDFIEDRNGKGRTVHRDDEYPHEFLEQAPYDG